MADLITSTLKNFYITGGNSDPEFKFNEISTISLIKLHLKLSEVNRKTDYVNHSFAMVIKKPIHEQYVSL